MTTKLLNQGTTEPRSPVCDLRVGHVLDVLAGMPSASVHVCVTSPPYLGLRHYETEAVVWAPASNQSPVASNQCDHVWGPEIPGDSRGGSGPGAKEAYAGDTTYARNAPCGSFCQLCGAWLGHLGLEPSVDLYIEHLVAVFRAVRRVLRPDGTCWVNIGDSYAGNSRGGRPNTGLPANRVRAREGVCAGTNLRGDGIKGKDLLGVPFRLALALQADGWWLRSSIIWAKGLSFCEPYAGQVMPQSCRDRPTHAYEFVFLLTPRPRYTYDRRAACEPASTNSHARGKGVNPKAMPPVGGWDTSTGNGSHSAARHNRGGRIRQNASFSVAVKDLVPVRNWRNVWVIPPSPFTMAMCRSCGRIYSGPELKKLAKDSDGRRVCAGCGSTDWLSHYATFPPALAEKCILAGSMPRTCSFCGAPYKRLVEKITEDTPESVEHARAQGADAEGGYQGTELADSAAAGAQDASSVKANVLKGSKGYRMLGWERRCSCTLSNGHSRSVVLDPFAGVASTALAARALDRDFIGIELSSEYVKLALDRLARSAKPTVAEAPRLAARRRRH